MNCWRRLSFLIPWLAVAFAAHAETTELRVGISVPLSGGVAAMGQAFRKGIQLFQTDYPHSKLQFRFEDNRYDGKDSVAAFRKLHEVDRSDVVIVWGNMPSDTCAPVAEANRLPMIAISMNPVAKDRSYVVSLGPPLEKLVSQVAAKFKEWKLSRPAAVSIDIGAALAGVESLRTQLGGDLLVKVIANEDVDFKTLIATFKAKGVDGLMLLALPQQALTFLRQSKQLHFQPRVIGGDVFADDAFQREGRAHIPELSFVYGAVEPNFVSRLRADFGEVSYFFESATAYATALLLHRVAEQNPHLSGESLLTAFSEVRTAQLPVEGLTFMRTVEAGPHFEVDGKIYQALE